MAKIVIALGGNALGNDAYEQMEKAAVAAGAVVDLIEAGHEVLIGHGNGPQVGMIKKAFDECEKTGQTPGMPFAECTAMSQGYIGYHLQSALEAELNKRGITDNPVVSLITRVVVHTADPAFEKPTKPVGGYCDETTARKIMQETGHVYGEDAGRGWRRMVASPMPVDIMEKLTVMCLLENKRVVIACGGGGIPVAEKDGAFTGVDAVVDKDFAAARMAQLIDADILFILTAVERVCINYRKPDEKSLPGMTVAEAKKLSGEGHFAPGSMLPKVQAACMFVESGKNRRAIITSLEKAAQALSGESGTVIE
ncbi:MAG: carbamate kinase [Defluviitaleaceae bacterium]|nr:carbamate kinase [Defluviitaleaceae bacterium]MCL2835777.1 carbamate kinase [Defluviitaleaceae bacterium]